MELFDGFFNEVQQYLDEMICSGLSRAYAYDEKLAWPRTENNHVILEADTAIELGHPRTESLAFMLWTESVDTVKDGRITIIGPNLNEIRDKQVPFGKITLLRCHGFNEDNAYERYTELDMVRFKLKIEDYMLRAMSQNMKEWSRVGKKGLSSGLSFQVLGTELIRDYKKLDYVDAVEIVFITSSVEDIKKLRPLGEKATRIIEAMNRIFDDLEFDCATCDFNDICDEIDGLRDMHNKAIK